MHETPARDREAEPNIAPEEEGTQRRRAFVASGLGWGLDGFDWTMFAYALPAITASLSLSASDGPFVVAFSLVASAFGGVVGGTLADRFGRVRVLTFVILGYSLFTALTATAQNLEQLLFWRALHGFTFGAEWAVGAALLAEYARPERRGRTMGFLQSTYAVGWAVSTAAYLILFDALNDETAWRYLFLLGILPAAAAFFIRLTTKDRIKTGASGGAKISFPLLFRRDVRRTSILATLFGVGGQGTYYSVFVFLPTFLIEERGQTVVGTATYSWVVIAGSFIGYVLAGFIHDALGRRPAFTLYFLGSAAAILAFVLIPIDGSFVTYAVSFFLGFFASGQAAGYGSFLAELFPSNMRAAGQGLAYNAGRGLAALGPGFIGMTADSIGLGASIVIVGTIACTLAITCVWLLPETRGRVIVERERPRRPLARVAG
ncbi:MAG: MFS transporter [Thermoleophilaceae bacterium]